MYINIENTLKNLKKYLDIPSPGGYTKNASIELEKDFKKLGLKTYFTKKGALIGTIEGNFSNKEISISAHIDTLGGIIKEINKDGTIRFHKIGGGAYNSLEGENCTIITRKNKTYRGSIVPKHRATHIYGVDVVSQKKDEFNMILRLDEIVFSKEDVLKLGINVGDFISMDPRFEVTESGFIKSRYLDNKSAIAMILEVLNIMNENNLKPKYTTNFIISNFEEQGHGVSYVPPKTEELLAIDIGPVGEGQTSTEFGVTIAAKDKRTVYDYDFRNKLIDICENNNIDFNVDVFNFYSSDSSQAIARGLDVNFACIGPGVDGTHHYERTHIKALENTINLLLHYITE